MNMKTIDKVREIMNANEDVDRKELIEIIVAEAGLKANSANVYISKVKSASKSVPKKEDYKSPTKRYGKTKSPEPVKASKPKKANKTKVTPKKVEEPELTPYKKGSETPTVREATSEHYKRSSLGQIWDNMTEEERSTWSRDIDKWSRHYLENPVFKKKKAS